MQEPSSATAPSGQPPRLFGPQFAAVAAAASEIDDRLDILLIEDNAADARLLQAHLAACDDLQVSWASTLGAALEQLASRSFAAILLDLSLPDARGGDLIARVQAAVPDTPIIVSSGQSAEDRLLTQAVIRKGAEDFLPKSEMTPTLVARTVTMAVERHRRRAGAHRTTDTAGPWGQARVARFVWSAADRQVRLLGDVGRLIGVDPAIAGAPDKVLIRRLPARMRHSLSVARRELRAGADRLSVVLVEPPAAGRAHDLAIDIVAEHDPGGQIIRLEGLCREAVMPSEVERLADGTTAALGHKLRTPLTAIRGTLGLLAGGAVAPLPPEARPLVDQAMVNADKLARLVAALLDPDGASIADAPLRAARRPFGVALDDAVTARQQAIHSAGIDVRLTFACRAIDRAVGIDRLRRALDCLLSHATSEPELEGSFSIEAMPGVGMVWLKLCRIPTEAPTPIRANEPAARDTDQAAADRLDALRVAVVLAE